MTQSQADEILKTEEAPIQFLNLYFPHGATVNQCQLIARNVEKIVSARVSEGGFSTTNKYGLYVDNVTFAEDSMTYEYGYKK